MPRGPGVMSSGVGITDEVETCLAEVK